MAPLIDGHSFKEAFATIEGYGSGAGITDPEKNRLREFVSEKLGQLGVSESPDNVTAYRGNETGLARRVECITDECSDRRAALVVFNDPQDVRITGSFKKIRIAILVNSSGIIEIVCRQIVLLRRANPAEEEQVGRLVENEIETQEVLNQYDLGVPFIAVGRFYSRRGWRKVLLVQPYFEMGNLYECLPHLTRSLRINVCVQLLEQLVRTSEIGFVHGDIKITNVVAREVRVGESERGVEVYLIDWANVTGIGAPFSTYPATFAPFEVLLHIRNKGPESERIPTECRLNTAKLDVFCLGLVCMEVFKSEVCVSLREWLNAFRSTNDPNEQYNYTIYLYPTEEPSAELDKFFWRMCNTVPDMRYTPQEALDHFLAIQHLLEIL